MRLTPQNIDQTLDERFVFEARDHVDREMVNARDMGDGATRVK